MENQDNMIKLKPLLKEASKSPDYIITSVPAPAIPEQGISRSDVALGLKMGSEFGMYGTLTNKHYKLDYEKKIISNTRPVRFKKNKK